MSKPAVLAIRAISIERLSRTVIEATTSPRASFSLTLFFRMSLAAIQGTPCGQMGWPDLRAEGMIEPDQPFTPVRARSVMKYDTNFKSVKDQVSAEEWQ